MDWLLHLPHLVVCSCMGFTAVGIVYILYHMSLVPLRQVVLCKSVGLYNAEDFPVFFFVFSFSILCGSFWLRIFFLDDERFLEVESMIIDE